MDREQKEKAKYGGIACFCEFGGERKENMCSSWEGEKGARINLWGICWTWVLGLPLEAKSSYSDIVECGNPDYEFSRRMLFIVYIFV